MPAVTVWIDIDAPLQRVWQVASNLAQHAVWMRDVQSITFDGPLTQGTGTEMRVATRIGPLRTMDLMTVTAWQPQRLIAIEHRGLVSGKGELRFDPVGGATRVTWNEQLHFPWRLGGPIGALLARPFFVWIWQRNLRALKALIEPINPGT